MHRGWRGGSVMSLTSNIVFGEASNAELNAELGRFVSANLPALRKLYSFRTARSSDTTDTTISEKEYLLLMADVTASYTLRPVMVEIFQNVYNLERCVGGCAFSAAVRQARLCLTPSPPPPLPSHFSAMQQGWERV